MPGIGGDLDDSQGFPEDRIAEIQYRVTDIAATLPVSPNNRDVAVDTDDNHYYKWDGVSSWVDQGVALESDKVINLNNGTENIYVFNGSAWNAQAIAVLNTIVKINDDGFGYKTLYIYDTDDNKWKPLSILPFDFSEKGDLITTDGIRPRKLPVNGGTNGSIIRLNSAAELGIDITDDVIVDPTTGYVGVGVVPLQNFEVEGDSSCWVISRSKGVGNAYFVVDSETGESVFDFLRDGNRKWLISNHPTSDVFNIRTGGFGSAQFTILQNGYVGIGATNPLKPVTIHPASTGVKIGLFYGGDSDNIYGFGVSSGQLNYHVSALTSSHVFYATGDNGDGIELLRIKGDGTIGVGITPISKLHVYENTSAVDASAGFTIEQAGSGDAVLQYYFTGSQRWVSGIDKSDANKFKIAFSENLGTNTALTITNLGRFGFGETTPETFIEVTNFAPYITLHNDTHEDTDGGRESFIIFKGEQSGGEESTLGKLGFSHDGVSNNQAGRFSIYPNDGSDGDNPNEAFRINRLGQVALGGGHLTPLGTLTVAGTAQSTYFRRSTLPNSNYLYLRTSSSNNWRLGSATNDNDLQLYSYGLGDTVLAVNYTNGNVGIRTSTPVAIIDANPTTITTTSYTRPWPSVTDTQLGNLVSMPEAAVVWDSDQKLLKIYDGSNWTNVHKQVSAIVRSDGNTTATAVVQNQMIIPYSDVAWNLYKDVGFSLPTSTEPVIVSDSIKPIEVLIDGNFNMNPALTGKALRAQFMLASSIEYTVTFDNTTNTILETGTTISNGDYFTFYDTAGTPPAEFNKRTVYVAINKTTNAFQASYDGVTPLTFTDDGTPTNSYKRINMDELDGSSVARMDISASAPLDLIPQALMTIELNDKIFPVFWNITDGVDILLNNAYYRVKS